MTALCALLAFGLLERALYLTDGLFRSDALTLALSSLVLAVAGACIRWPPTWDASARKFLAPVAASILGLGLWGLLTKRPGYYLIPQAGPALIFFYGGVAAAALVSLSYWSRNSPFGAAKFPVLLAIYVFLGGWMIHWSPRPMIDVWFFQQRGAGLLIAGQNPYSSDYENIYGSTTAFYSDKTLRNNRIVSFTYPPLTLLLGLPAKLTGDVRWSLLMAVAGASAFMIGLLRKNGFSPGHPLELVVAAFLFHPRAYFLIEQAWTEPYVALGAAATVWALSTGSATALWLCLALLLSAKQYAVLLFPPLWRSERMRLVDIALATAAAAAIALPFFLWAPGPFFEGVVVLQFGQPLRPEALSVLAAVAQRTGIILPSVIGFLAAAFVTALVCWRVRGDVSKSVLGGAAVFLAFFAFNKQAFFNYYWFGGSLLILSVVASTDHLVGEKAVTRDPE